MFSNAERCRYGKPQLIEVVCQLRFPTILKIENQSPYEFQELIRGEYPNYSVKEERPPAQANAPKETVKNHQFISLDGGWKVNLTRSFVSLSTHRYTVWEDFAQRLDRILAHLIGVYKPACFNRVGLRYINAFNRERLELEGVSWRELIQPGFLGLMADEDVPESAFGKNEQSVNLALPGGARCGIKCGPGVLHKVNNKTRQTVDEPAFMLDIDVYMDGNIEMSHTAAGLNIVHTHADSIFRGAITDTLHDAMEPQEI